MAQWYDNAAKMAEKYIGAQAKIEELNSVSILSPCVCHALNLCGYDAAVCLPETITYCDTLQAIYNLFRSYPQRLKLHKIRLCCSLYGISETGWSARLQCSKPIASHLNGI